MWESDDRFQAVKDAELELLNGDTRRDVVRVAELLHASTIRSRPEPIVSTCTRVPLIGRRHRRDGAVAAASVSARNARASARKRSCAPGTSVI